jgi:hypothetical protein
MIDNNQGGFDFHDSFGHSSIDYVKIWKRAVEEVLSEEVCNKDNRPLVVVGAAEEDGGGNKRDYFRYI